MIDAFTLLKSTCNYDQTDEAREELKRALQYTLMRLVYPDHAPADVPALRAFIRAVAASDLDVPPDVRRIAELHFLSQSHAIRRAVDDDDVLVAALRKLTRPYVGTGQRLYRGQLAGKLGICWTTELNIAAIYALWRSEQATVQGNESALMLYEIDAPARAILCQLEQVPRWRQVISPEYLVDCRALPSPPIDYGEFLRLNETSVDLARTLARSAWRNAF